MIYTPALPFLGATPTQSEMIFSEYFFSLLCRQTPLFESTHGVPIDAVGTDFRYSKHCVQRLQQDEFEQAKRVGQTFGFRTSHHKLFS